VIYNGIDAVAFGPDPGLDQLGRLGIDTRTPYVLFVGRVTRQKGIETLVESIPSLDEGIGVVIAAGQPDTPELAAEVERGIRAARSASPRRPIHWVREQVDRTTLRQLYTHAAVFACPSVYEPFGITNLEAMACSTAVVASRVGGIPEVVLDGTTGLLVDPEDPRALAAAFNALVGDPRRRVSMGEAGRIRAAEQFGWAQIAQRTTEVYRSVAR